MRIFSERLVDLYTKKKDNGYVCRISNCETNYGRWIIQLSPEKKKIKL